MPPTALKLYVYSKSMYLALTGIVAYNFRIFLSLFSDIHALHKICFICSGCLNLVEYFTLDFNKNPKRSPVNILCGFPCPQEIFKI